MNEPTELTCISTKSELRAWTSGELDKIVTKTDRYWIEYSDGNRLLAVSYTHLRAHET